MDLHQYEDRLGLSPCYVLTPLCFPNVSSRVMSCIFLFADFWDSKAFQGICWRFGNETQTSTFLQTWMKGMEEEDLTPDTCNLLY